jgi:hypothetical protein
MTVPLLRDGTRLFASPGEQGRPETVMSPMKLIQLGIDPRDKWLDLILEITRTVEGKSRMKSALTSQDAGKLEQSFYEFVDEQGDFVNECQDLTPDHEVRRNYEKYIEMYSGIKGGVGLEDCTVSRLAVAVHARGSSEPASPVSASQPELPTHLPLCEGLEIYVDGKTGAVVLSPDAEITGKKNHGVDQEPGS